MLVAGIALALLAKVPASEAALGYEPASSNPVIALGGTDPLGVAIDQSSQQIYAAVPIGAGGEGPGFVAQLEPSGSPTAASPFTGGSTPVFVGVAVDPSSPSPHSIYVAESVAMLPQGTFGASRIVPFSASGVMGTPFATENPANVAPQIAVDSSGRIFYPSITAAAVKVYNSSGAVQETILCGGCPGGAFDEPIAAALDAANNLYVVDQANGRVLKFTHSSGPYVYSAELQTGKQAVAVAVDTTNGSVLVGDYPGGNSYHVVAYDSGGAQFDDFGGGLFHEGFPPVDGRLAVNATTHKVYVGDVGGGSLRVFELTTIHPPTATTEPASSVGQVGATLNAKVNANLHAISDCHFEYADDAFFQAHGFSGSTQRPCPSLPSGSNDTLEGSVAGSLAPDTTYHFRVVATNNAGTSTGNPQSFTTMPQAPAAVTTEPAVSLSTAGATLKGKVNPHGGAVSSCKFEYGPTTAYGKSASCPTPIGNVTTDVAESFRATGLTPTTTYHFRLAVTTNAGTVNGNDAEFTTLSPLSEELPREESLPGAGPIAPLPTPISIPTVEPPKRLLCRRGFSKRRVHGKLRCVKKKKKHSRRGRRSHKAAR